MASYANPDVLVETTWVAEHLADVNVQIVESDEDVLLYDAGHVPGVVNAYRNRQLHETAGAG